MENQIKPWNVEMFLFLYGSWVCKRDYLPAASITTKNFFLLLLTNPCCYSSCLSNRNKLKYVKQNQQTEILHVNTMKAIYAAD